MTENNHQQTLVLIKPDAMKNSLTGYVLSLLSEYHTDLRFSAAKVVNVNEMLAGEHYAEHKGKVFFDSLLEYIAGKLHYPNEPGKRRVIALVYHGPNAVKQVRNIAGPTNPHSAREENPGCIRSLGTIVPLYDKDGKEVGDRMDNLIHGSANRDAEVFENPDELDIDRNPQHVAFGIGNHFCMGANLARMELRVALVELLKRIPDMSYATVGPEFGPSALVRSVQHMHVKFTPESKQ